MIIVFSNKKKKVLKHFKRLKIVNNELFSLSTEASFLNENSPDNYVKSIEYALEKFRKEKEEILLKIDELSQFF